MAKILNFKQQLTGAFGSPIAENPTQAMIEAAYRHHGLDWRYLTIEVAKDDLADAVRGARAMGFRGFNCTIPHKVAVIEHLDGLGESASVMGAVNCVVRRGHQLIGENTDGKGFLEALRPFGDPRGKRVVVFGAGGASRAITVELALAGARSFVIVNRSESRGSELVRLLVDRVKTEARLVVVPDSNRTSGASREDFSVPEATDIVVNATSVGLFPDIDARLPLDASTLKSGMIVADVIPNPPRTRLVRDATERGCKVIDGLAMLVNQGVIGIKHWTGIDPDPFVMRKALENVFAGAV